jgi:hypothetical protein
MVVINIVYGVLQMIKQVYKVLSICQKHRVENGDQHLTWLMHASLVFNVNIHSISNMPRKSEVFSIENFSGYQNLTIALKDMPTAYIFVTRCLEAHFVGVRDQITFVH